MAQTTLEGPNTHQEGPNTRDETADRGWSWLKTLDAINEMFTELYAAIATGVAAVAALTTTADSVALDRALKLPSYTVATAPEAADAGAGATIYVTDGDAGDPCVAVSDGTDWLVSALGAAIATS